MEIGMWLWWVFLELVGISFIYHLRATFTQKRCFVRHPNNDRFSYFSRINFFWPCVYFNFWPSTISLSCYLYRTISRSSNPFQYFNRFLTVNESYKNLFWHNYYWHRFSLWCVQNCNLFLGGLFGRNRCWFLKVIMNE